MMRTSASGMAAQASRLGTVADNIANASTTGYKRASTEFSSLILERAAEYRIRRVESRIHRHSEQAPSVHDVSTDLASRARFLRRFRTGGQSFSRARAHSCATNDRQCRRFQADGLHPRGHPKSSPTAPPDWTPSTSAPGATGLPRQGPCPSTCRPRPWCGRRPPSANAATAAYRQDLAHRFDNSAAR